MYKRQVREHERYRQIAPITETLLIGDEAYASHGIDYRLIFGLNSMLVSFRNLPGHIGERIKKLAHKIYNYCNLDAALSLACIKQDRRALRSIVTIRKARQVSLKATVAIRALEAAAYRAHVARRVQPITRRTRPPRAVYARPRPPTCPLAPPVA